MLGSISYGTVEYAGLLPGWQSPRFSFAWKNLRGTLGSGDKTSAIMTKQSLQGWGTQDH